MKYIKGLFTTQPKLWAFIAVIVFIGSTGILSGCSSMEKLTPIAGNNCIDYVLAKKKTGDVLIWGRYLPEPNPDTYHLWLERDGVCYDNMNKAGFNCDSRLYKANEWVNPNHKEVFAMIYAKRG